MANIVWANNVICFRETQANVLGQILFFFQIADAIPPKFIFTDKAGFNLIKVRRT